MPDAPAIPTVALNDGRRIPQLGFGVFQVPRSAAEQVVSTALQAGYRHVDTAAAYGNEAEVGRALRVADDHVYVTTKYFNPGEDHGRRDARNAFEASVARLGLDHVDLYLVHWPVRAGEGFTESWRELTELRDHSAMRSIGVSNFSAAQLARIATEAWGPLGQGERHAAKVLRDPTLAAIARARGRSVAQVVIRWHLQLGTIVIPKSADAARIRENIDVLGFELSEHDMDAIAALDRGARNGPDPDTFDFPTGYRGQAHERG